MTRRVHAYFKSYKFDKLTWLWLALAVAAAVATTAVTTLQVRARLDQRWDPLGTYPLQLVKNRLPGVDGPALRLGDPLMTTGTKCNRSDRQIFVRGERQWSSVNPGGYIAPAGGGSAYREPGCETKDYINDVPPGVQVQMRWAIAQNHGRPVIWSMEGVEYPIDVDGSEGVPRRWRTANFEVHP